MLISRENSRARDSHWGANTILNRISIDTRESLLYVEEAAALAYEHANQVAERKYLEKEDSHLRQNSHWGKIASGGGQC